MIQLIHPRMRIGIVLIASFFISGLLMKYAIGETETIPPSIQVQSIVADFTQGISNTGTTLLSSIQSIRVPSLVTFPTPEPEVNPPVQHEEPTPPEWNTEPIPNEPPTSTPAYFPPGTTEPTDTPISNGPLPTQRPQPTTAPKPTNVPKPTKVPKPTTAVYPPITDDVRPGSSIEEIMRDVEKRACVPYKLMMAIRTLEAGNWFNNMSASTTKMYNTYGWWKTADKGTVCSGLGYYTQSGIIPPDSGGAGETCNSKIGLQTYDLKIMGIMQASEQEQEVTRKYTIKTLPKSIDRRVLFDNILIFAIATKNRAGSNPQPSCSDWPEETVKEVARIHASGSSGSCNYTYSQNGKSGNYCTEIWNLYKSFK